MVHVRGSADDGVGLRLEVTECSLVLGFPSFYAGSVLVLGRDDVCVRWEGDPSFDEVMVGFIEEVGSV